MAWSRVLRRAQGHCEDFCVSGFPRMEWLAWVESEKWIRDPSEAARCLGVGAGSLVPAAGDPGTCWAVGVGTRMALSTHVEFSHLGKMVEMA